MTSMPGRRQNLTRHMNCVGTCVYTCTTCISNLVIVGIWGLLCWIIAELGNVHRHTVCSSGGGHGVRGQRFRLSGHFCGSVINQRFPGMESFSCLRNTALHVWCSNKQMQSYPTYGKLPHKLLLPAKSLASYTIKFLRTIYTCTCISVQYCYKLHILQLEVTA